MSILPPKKGLEFPGGGGGDSVRPKNLKKHMKLNWIPEGWGGGLRKNLFRGGGMDIFWNYTFVS